MRKEDKRKRGARKAIRLILIFILTEAELHRNDRKDRKAVAKVSIIHVPLFRLANVYYNSILPQRRSARSAFAAFPPLPLHVLSLSFLFSSSPLLLVPVLRCSIINY